MNLTGFVFDATTGQPIPAATIAVVKNNTLTGEGTVADSNGDFSVSVADPATSQLKISSIGYNPVVINSSDASEVSLFPASNQLPGVTITAQAPQTPYKDAWQSIKPAIPVVLGIFVLGYIVTSHHDKKRKKYSRR